MYTIINPHACLTANENILVFFTLTHTNYLFERQQHFALSSQSSFPCTALSRQSLSMRHPHYFSLCGKPLITTYNCLYILDTQQPKTSNPRGFSQAVTIQCNSYSNTQWARPWCPRAPNTRTILNSTVPFQYKQKWSMRERCEQLSETEK